MWGSVRLRGIDQLSNTACVVFAENAGEDAALVATHEIGHMLHLSKLGPRESPDINKNGHDPGPFPGGSEGTMQAGTGTNKPGLWLAHQDWEEANKAAEP